MDATLKSAKLIEEFEVPVKVRLLFRLPILVGPLPRVVLIWRAPRGPVSQSEAEAAVKFRAPALVRDKPPVPGPVMLLATAPEKTRLLPSVVTPVIPIVPPTVSLPVMAELVVTFKELSVAAPALKVPESAIEVALKPAKVVAPVTPREPPNVVAPVPTVKVLVPVTPVGPLRLTAPEPVEKLVAPVWLKLPEVVIGPTAKLEVPKLAEVREVAVKVVPLIVTLPPKVAKPVPTVKVLVPVTPVLPLRLTAPVPVEKVPVPT